MNRRISVRDTIDKVERSAGAAKTRASRYTVEIDGKMIAILQQHRDNLERSGYTGPLVFPNRDGRFLDADNLRNRILHSLLKQAQCPEAGFRDLRHTMAALMLTAGVPIKTVSERLGH